MNNSHQNKVIMVICWNSKCIYDNYDEIFHWGEGISVHYMHTKVTCNVLKCITCCVSDSKYNNFCDKSLCFLA